MNNNGRFLRFFTFGATGRKKVSASTLPNPGQGAGTGDKHAADDTVALGNKQDGGDLR